MKSSMLAPAATLAVLAALAGCKTADGQSRLASHDTTVEYYRVFDIRTEAAVPVVAQAASAGVGRNLKDAVVNTPEGVQVAKQPGRFKMADKGSAAGASCEGAAWTAKAAPKVRGGDNMNVVACLFPYKGGYHLDMYTVFTKPEGGWLYWPRRIGGTLLGTPERFTDDTMLEVVRTIRESTGAAVTLVEARPGLSGTPWLEPAKTPAASTAAPANSPAIAPTTAPTTAPAAAPTAVSQTSVSTPATAP
jgi:hypothetical protein